MSQLAVGEEVLIDAPIIQRTQRQIAWGRFKRNKVGVVSACITLFFVLLAVLAPVITRLLGLSSTQTYPKALNEFAMPIGRWGGMSLAHPLGVEPGAGRDLLSLMLYGSRLSFSIGVLSSVATIGVGMLIGITTGYFRGKIDAVVGRVIDFLLSFPSVFMIIALSLPLTQRIEATGIARDNNARVIVLVAFFTFFTWPYYSRLFRSQAFSLRERDFIMAAQALGASSWRIITKELLPNLWPTAIVFLSLSLPGFLSAEAAYSFLGVGVQAPASDFGLVLSDSINYWRSDTAYLVIPTIYLVVIVLALNLLGDAIRDALDPKAAPS